VFLSHYYCVSETPIGGLSEMEISVDLYVTPALQDFQFWFFKNSQNTST
jgi:hypothetical protein